METLEAIRRRIDNAEDMQSVVTAMKVLAVVSIRQFEKSLESLDGCNRAVELGLQTLLMEPPPELRLDLMEERSAGRTCAIIIGSEQGLSGQFNERISAFSLGRLSEMGLGPKDRSLVALGDHMTYRLKAAKDPAEKSFPIHGTVKGMKSVVQQLFFYIDEMRQRGDCARVLLFYHQSQTGAQNRPHMTQLFPLDPAVLRELSERPWPSRSRPTFTMDWQPLLRSLVRQYFRVTLERAFVQSLLSENTSRLVAMQVAEGNIADHLEELQREFNDQRQSEITAEILDIVAGLEAVEKVESRSIA